MNILERNIFDKNISFTQKLYQEKINEINKSEEIFRSIVRKNFAPRMKNISKNDKKIYYYCWSFYIKFNNV